MRRSIAKVKVGITMGDPSGVGPVIISKALRRLRGAAEFTVIGEKKVFLRAAKSIAKAHAHKFIDLHNVAERDFQSGKVKAEYGRASVEYLDKALDLIRQGNIDCLVTCPISKDAINRAGIHFSGHTEYLAARTNSRDLVMMLLNDKLRFSLVTRHIPLKKVPAALNAQLLRKTIILSYTALKKLFAVKNPRLVVCGLNPHASDNGLLGDEEKRVICPELRRLKKIAGYIAGPLSADVAIAGAFRGDYDCVIAMYHDQALIPLKLLGNHSGVNLTLGLPFIRTSPLHGTAFDIAATDKADPGSLIAAIKLAVKCTLNLKKA